MSESRNLRTGRHCIFLMHVHLVFVTKYRENIFSEQILAELKGIFAKIANDFEAELKEFNGEHDHVHLLINYPPKIAVSKLVNSLKGASSRLRWSAYQYSSQIHRRTRVVKTLRDSLISPP